MFEGWDAEVLARAQLASAMSFHIVFPAFSIGLASYLAVLETLWLWTGREALINLFNLIPVCQLDGSRGLRSLTRSQRGLVLAATAALWYFTVPAEPSARVTATASTPREGRLSAAGE